MDTGTVRLIPTSEGVQQDKKIQTIYQAPDSRLLVKISKENGDDVKTSAQELDSEESESVDIFEGVLAEAAAVERNEDTEADLRARKEVSEDGSAVKTELDETQILLHQVQAKNKDLHEELDRLGLDLDSKTSERTQTVLER